MIKLCLTRDYSGNNAHESVSTCLYVSLRLFASISSYCYGSLIYTNIKFHDMTAFSEELFHQRISSEVRSVATRWSRYRAASWRHKKRSSRWLKITFHGSMYFISVLTIYLCATLNIVVWIYETSYNFIPCFWVLSVSNCPIFWVGVFQIAPPWNSNIQLLLLA